MPRPEKIIVGVAGLLFALAAVLEGLSRLGDQPALHDVATWAAMAALFAVLTPIAVATAVIACQSLISCKKDRDSDAAQPGRPPDPEPHSIKWAPRPDD